MSKNHSAELSYLKGTPISAMVERLPANLVAALLAASAGHRDKGIIFIRQGAEPLFISYPKLVAAAVCVASALDRVKPGMPVLLQLRAASEFLIAFWAVLMRGGIPVPLGVPASFRDDDQVSEKLVSTLKSLPHAVVLAEPVLTADIADWLGRKIESTPEIIDFTALSGDPEWNGLHAAGLDETAIFLQTSGSTSAPKMVPQTHRRLLLRTLGAIEFNNFSADDVSLNCFPLDHVCGIVMCHLKDVALGCSQVIAPISRFLARPLNLLDWCAKYRVTVTWAPNFAYNLLCSYHEQILAGSWDLSSVRFMENCAEPVVPSQCLRFLELLVPHGLRPDVIKPSWGMSETCSVTVLSHAFHPAQVTAEDRFAGVGKPFPGMEVKVVDSENRTLRQGEIGQLHVRGAQVLDAYYNRPEANRESFPGDGWFDTGDLAIIQDGQLTIVGRSKDIIIINGNNIAAHEIEGCVERLEGVIPSYTAAVPVRQKTDATDRLAIFFHTDRTGAGLDRLLASMRIAVGRSFGTTPDYLINLDAQSVPKTAVGKIQKDKLRSMLLGGKVQPTYTKLDARIEADVADLAAAGIRTWKSTNLEQQQRRPSKQTEAICLFVPDACSGSVLAAEVQGLAAKPVHLVFDRKKSDLSSDHCIASDEARIEDYRNCLAAVKEDVISVVIVGQSVSDGPTEVFSLDPLSRVTAVLRACSAARRRIRKIMFIGANQQFVDLLQRRAGLVEAASTVLMESFARETPGIVVRSIDVEDQEVRAVAAILAVELLDGGDAVEVAYRDGRRLVSHLTPCTFRRVAEPRLARGATYVVTGALGGIGSCISRHLLEIDSRVVMIGRKARCELPADKLEILTAMEASHPGRIVYEEADVAHLGALEAALAKASSEIGGIPRGIIHAASETCWGTFAAMTANDDVARRFPAKTVGTWNLYCWAVEHRVPFLANIASVNGLVGGSAAAAYSAANRVQEAIADYASLRPRGPQVLCLAWSRWDGIGMSVGSDTESHRLTRAQGFQVLEQSAAMERFKAAMESDRRTLFIGVDWSHPRFSERLRSKAPVVENEELANVNSVAFLAIDVATLETRLATIWNEVLGGREVKVDDNLFDVGTTSLKLQVVLERIRSELGLDIAVALVFEFSTIRGLAEHLINDERIAVAKC